MSDLTPLSDIERFRPGVRQTGRSRLGVGDGETVIGTVGRLDPIKDQATLVAAFSRLVARHDSLRLLLVGDGPCRRSLEEQVARLELDDRVTFLGRRDDVSELLRAMDVFVLPSLAEGASNTILEAMATGVPVVATRVGGNPELIEEGETGFLVPRRDVTGLSAAIERYVANRPLTEQHGTAARGRSPARCPSIRCPTSRTSCSRSRK